MTLKHEVRAVAREFPVQGGSLTAAADGCGQAIGLRFLPDFLANGIYFTVRRDGHRLDRGRTRFKLVDLIEPPDVTMNRLVESL